MNEVIVVKNLKKSFKTKLKKESIRGSLKSIFSKEYRTINAVDDVSFNIKKGELVGFIGPNGAGKSTTLKMLSGILYPDSGKIRILNKDPTKFRKELSYKIGTVFGQKPQLWFHLPAMDSFYLFSKIYDLDPVEFEKRINSLIDVFEIRDIVYQPVRKLSLGQRMRCEFVLALLHNPEVLYLDEPTIGLDIIVKKNIRQLIKKINKINKTTIILTSHDIDDIENITNRIIIINKGRKVYDGSFKDLKKNYLNTKIIKISSDSKIELEDTKEITILKRSKYQLEFELNTKKLPLKKVVSYILQKYNITDISINEPKIEEIIEKIYKEEIK